MGVKRVFGCLSTLILVCQERCELVKYFMGIFRPADVGMSHLYRAPVFGGYPSKNMPTGTFSPGTENYEACASMHETRFTTLRYKDTRFAW